MVRVQQGNTEDGWKFHIFLYLFDMVVICKRGSSPGLKESFS